MEFLGIILVVINILIIGFVIWTVSNINEKLELLIRIQLKKDDIHFSDKDIEEEAENYRDKKIWVKCVVRIVTYFLSLTLRCRRII